MKRIVLVGCLSVTTGLAACANKAGPAFAPVAAGTPVVELTTGLRFKPETLTIRVGQTVEFRNRAIETHTVTDEPDKAHDGDMTLPAGAQAFNSGALKPGEVFRHQFTTPGTYHYICEPHHGLGMKGVIVVTG